MAYTIPCRLRCVKGWWLLRLLPSADAGGCTVDSIHDCDSLRAEHKEQPRP